MTLRQLESFLALARDGSFTLAAQRLHLSQPTLTEHIQELEREVGKLCRVLDDIVTRVKVA